MTRLLLMTLVVTTMACRTSTHAVTPSKLGTVSSTAAMLAVIDQPGPIELETVNSADWEVDRSGLINLDSPKAKDAKLVDGPEPIHVYFHVLKHPTQGTWWVDSGMEHAFRDDPSKAAATGMVASAMHLEKLKVHVAPSDWLKDHPEGVKGVLLTHMHLDHISGVPDLPAETAIYSGPGEANDHAFMNLFTQGTADRQLNGKPAVNELQFAADATGTFDGVIDLFGDGSVWALSVPGHTVSSVAYLVRTTKGPVLLTGDTCHTRWGWENEVEPGSFTSNQAKNLESLKKLRALVEQHPAISVRLGHQE